MRIVTPLTPVFTKKSTTDPTFIPATGPLNSGEVQAAVVGLYLANDTFGALQLMPGFQYSHDGISWSDAYAIPMGTDPNVYTDTAGWTYPPTLVSELESMIGADSPRLFVRFGYRVRNSSATNKVESGMARLSIAVRGVRSGTVAYGPAKVNCGATDGAAAFTPLGGAMDAGQITALRATIELLARPDLQTSQELTIGAAYQVSSDGVTWTNNAGTSGASQAFGATRTAAGISYGGAFASATPSAALIRFGVQCSFSGGTLFRACLANLRVDWR